MKHAWVSRVSMVTLVGVIVLSTWLVLMADRALADGGDQSEPLDSQETDAALYVTNNGVDNQACGTKAAPCRSISQAIAYAKDGDKILVGPGRYGDLNGNGSFSDWEMKPQR